MYFPPPNNPKILQVYCRWVSTDVNNQCQPTSRITIEDYYRGDVPVEIEDWERITLGGPEYNIEEGSERNSAFNEEGESSDENLHTERYESEPDSDNEEEDDRSEGKSDNENNGLVDALD